MALYKFARTCRRPNYFLLIEQDYRSFNHMFRLFLQTSRDDMKVSYADSLEILVRNIFDYCHKIAGLHPDEDVQFSDLSGHPRIEDIYMDAYDKSFQFVSYCSSRQELAMV